MALSVGGFNALLNVLLYVPYPFCYANLTVRLTFHATEFLDRLFGGSLLL